MEIYVQMKGIPSEEQLDAMVSEAMNGMTRENMEQTMLQALTEQMGMDRTDLESYLVNMSDEELNDIFTQMLMEQMKMQYAAQVQQQMSTMQPAEIAAAMAMEMETLSDEQCAVYYDEIMVFSNSSYEENSNPIGLCDFDWWLHSQKRG